MKSFWACLLVLTMLISGCASSKSSRGDVHVGPDFAEETEIGRKIHAEILASFYIYTDQRVVAYVHEIGAKLTSQAKRQELPYSFTILYNDKIYATSAPGGYVYVTTGMMNFLDSEAELAAVLAHEIAQIQYKDPRLSMARKIFTGVTQTGAAVGPAFGPIGALAVLGLVMMHAAVDSTGRTPEERLSDADEKALRYLVAAGYDPQSLAEVIHKFLRADKQMIPYFYDYYQSRPISDTRVSRLESMFAKLDLGDKELLTRHQTYQEMTKGIREIYKQ